MEKGRSNGPRWAVIPFVLLSRLLTAFPLWAAYPVVRPIGDTGGQIDQT